MYKLVSCHSDTLAPDGTRYNDPPKGLRRIDEKAFAQSKYFSYSPELIEFRQIYVKSNDDLSPDRKGIMISMTLYWFHDDTGIAIHADYWKGKVEYFAFGCKHEYKELSQEECRERNIQHYGRCYHVSECKKCGYINAVDSSD